MTAKDGNSCHRVPTIIVAIGARVTLCPETNFGERRDHVEQSTLSRHSGKGMCSIQSEESWTACPMDESVDACTFIIAEALRRINWPLS